MPSTVVSARGTAVSKTSKGVYAQDHYYSWKIQTVSVNKEISGTVNSYIENKQDKVIKIGVLF